MASRRMFAKVIIDSDVFLDMPISARLLYYDLGMRADDDGFVNSPKKITRMIGASDDDLRLLIAKKFIIPFESGVCVIKDWRIHNYIKSDRYQPTQYIDEKARLELSNNKSYEIVGTEMEPQWNQSGTEMDTQVRLGKSKVSIELESEIESEIESGIEKPLKKGAKTLNKENLNQYRQQIEMSALSDGLKTKMQEWLTYKSERKDYYQPTGFNSLLTQILKKEASKGFKYVLSSIDNSMANNWKGIIWDKEQTPQYSMANKQQQGLTAEGRPIRDIGIDL